MKGILAKGSDETAKSLLLCKAVLVGDQLELTKEPLEVIGNNHPR